MAWRSGVPREVQAELAHPLSDGPGIVVLNGAFGNDIVAATDEFTGGRTL